ncbi:MAG: hypothetical protein N4J56_003269 [Chroococcidiopsis sp. SAG 2025]|nr:hypothetical protein [Chroococcidiopsis sp. SAG 2025]
MNLQVQSSYVDCILNSLLVAYRQPLEKYFFHQSQKLASVQQP